FAGCTSQGAPIVVEWSTETEVNTVGFNLYRAESPDGPFEKINKELIPASPDPLAGGHYVYTDTNVIAGRTYYYQLEDVESTGATTRHGPIVVRAEPQWPRWVWAVSGVALALLIAWWRTRGRRPRPAKSESS
ncbi:MAG TPA: hypothetical protein G4O02_11620, partial [Caldilineae bacterium]|nr:hypothetical protein [Caldilineae bacterium]